MEGKLIVLEGSDSAGKRTQSEMLLERLKKEGFEASLISFPRYETFFGKLVKKYLSGEFGSLEKVKPELASLLYSLDRYDAMPEIEKLLDEGKVVVLDRYTASNVAHQASKFSGEERDSFIKWMEAVESRLPKPNLTIFLDLPVEVSLKLMKERPREKDIHELNSEYLKATREVYISLSENKDWEKIDCAQGNSIKPREEIRKMVWERVSKVL